MTAPAPGPLTDRALDRLLAHATIPPPSPGLAGRIVAEASRAGRVKQIEVAPASSRRRRRPWTRRTLAGIVAINLLAVSALAAAFGGHGGLGRLTAQVAQTIAAIMPHRHALPPPYRVQQRPAPRSAVTSPLAVAPSHALGEERPVAVAARHLVEPVGASRPLPARHIQTARPAPPHRVDHGGREHLRTTAAIHRPLPPGRRAAHEPVSPRPAADTADRPPVRQAGIGDRPDARPAMAEGRAETAPDRQQVDRADPAEARPRQERAGQERARQGRAGQGRVGQGRAGQRGWRWREGGWRRNPGALRAGRWRR